MICLMRSVTVKSQQIHQKIWKKTALGACEIRGKKLGIVGYGNIGAQLSVLAESLGMQVYYYDIQEKLALGNAKKCRSLNELLKLADVVSLHVDGRKANTNFITKDQLMAMKPGSILLNLSRGHVVDLDALADVLQSGQLAGAAVDVYPEEPVGASDTFTTPLQGLDNVILTPHVGGSTQEAQENIGEFVPQRIVKYMNTGGSNMRVNFPEIQLPELQESHRIIHIHRNEPGVLANINDVFASHKLNIVGQYLKTNPQIGYVITDVEKDYSNDIMPALKSIPHTVRVRILY
jgi:D-3-phosphoglycerate dehydrogenase / 2-oxoglutarate reductase